MSACHGKIHQFNKHELAILQEKLLLWYNREKRTLPWRTIAKTEEDKNKRIYAVWISEIMLQQTQVATVIPYYNKWLTKWPTVSHLADASLENVNEVWTGLGYYSRAKRLHEGAKKIVEEMNGEFPVERDALIKQIPGVGKYTGSAIASIAMQRVVGVVDGNVSRVLTRLRAIGADITSQTTMDILWGIADEIVDKSKPGDFNQAVMELGATVCTPKDPSCSSCPLQSLCLAYRKTSSTVKTNSIANFFRKEKGPVENGQKKTPDIECVPDCSLCLPKEEWINSSGVLNFPRKSKKTKSRQETTAVVIICSGENILVVQRPKTGLLANLWEFPSMILGEGEMNVWEERISDQLVKEFGLTHKVAAKRFFISDVVHIFSHIHQTYK